MRIAGLVQDEKRAITLCSYLYLQGINSEPRQGDDNTFEIWVMDEDQLPDAVKILKEFLNNPDDPKYTKLVRLAVKKKAREEKTNKAYDKKYYSRTSIFSTLKGGSFNISSVTGILIAISVVITLASWFGKVIAVIRPFLITNYIVDGNLLNLSISLSEIYSGQVWRLVTPIFIHLGFMHILFNMMWLKDLGSMIERKHGPAYFLIMVILMAIIVTPFGVIAAIYLHEYAKKGPITKMIRIAVINLAGVPSIVYGVFGLGFFVSMMG